MSKKDLHELCLSWSIDKEFNWTPIISAEQVLEVLQPHANLKSLKILNYDGSCFPGWIRILSSLVSLELRFCNNL
ncbi:NBS-LRR disease resistance protein, partial [Trifolium medium]|nr:NBS-LRR disease resistance protein [Trifolium medium]